MHTIFQTLYVVYASECTYISGHNPELLLFNDLASHIWLDGTLLSYCPHMLTVIDWPLPAKYKGTVESLYYGTTWSILIKELSLFQRWFSDTR